MNAEEIRRAETLSRLVAGEMRLVEAAGKLRFGFAHRALQPQREPIVEVRRIPDAVFVQNQRRIHPARH